MTNFAKKDRNFIVWKSADQIVYNVGLTDDTALKFTARLNATYAFKLTLLRDQSNAATAGWVNAWSYPVNTTIFWNLVKANDDVLACSIETTTITNSTAVTSPTISQFNGIIKTTNNAGTIQFRSGQATPQAANSTIRAGSILEVKVL